MFLALGSNLGDRHQHLKIAIAALASPALHIKRVSPIYETAPQGYRDQGWFLNLVIEAETSLRPLHLLAYCEHIEQALHRERSVPNGPRTIDIDILFYGSQSIREEQLEIPHPRYDSRRFVLKPLSDLEPDFHDPLTGRSVRDMLAAVEDQPLRLV